MSATKRPPTAAATATGLTFRSGMSTAPSDLVAWLEEQLPNARLVSLKVMSATSTGNHQTVSSWDAASRKPDALAETIWRTALEDAQNGQGFGGSHYYAAITRKDGSEGAQKAIRILPPRGQAAAESLAVDPPTPDGIFGQALRHLNIREQASHTLLVEGLDGIFTAIRLQLDQATKNRDSDTKHFEVVIAGYERLVRVSAEAFAHTTEQLAAHLKRVQDAYDKLVSKQLEAFPMVEELATQRHEKELITIKTTHAEKRKDRWVEKAEGVLFPAIAAKMGLPASVFLGGNFPGSAPPAPPAAPTNGKSAPPAPAPNVPEGMQLRATSLGDKALRAIEDFLWKFDTADFEPVRAALKPDSRARFDAVIDAIAEQMMAAAGMAPPAPPAATTNGVAKEVPS